METVNEEPARVQPGQHLLLDHPEHGHDGTADEIEAAPEENQKFHDAENHRGEDSGAGEQSSLSPVGAGNRHFEAKSAASSLFDGEHSQILPNEISPLVSGLGEAALIDSYLLELAALDPAGSTPAVNEEGVAVLDVPPILSNEENDET